MYKRNMYYPYSISSDSDEESDTEVFFDRKQEFENDRLIKKKKEMEANGYRCENPLTKGSTSLFVAFPVLPPFWSL